MIEVWIYDELEEIQVTAMPWRLSSKSDSNTLVPVSPRGVRESPYFATIDNRPTKQESLDRLYAAYDVTSKFPKGGARGTLIHEFAYVGATALILLDPLDRTR